MKRITAKKVLYGSIVVLAAGMQGCGGGSGNSEDAGIPTNAPQLTSSSLVWNQGDWNRANWESTKK
jgi:hypothetical protein